MKRTLRPVSCLLLTVLLGGGVLSAGAAEGYRKPPQAVLDVLNAPPTPLVSFSPTRERMVLIEWVRHPPIADLARPMLRLAGLRIDPASNGPHEPRRYTGFRLKALPDGREIPVKTPAGAALSAPIWSPDGKRFAFTHTSPTGIELWLADAATGSTRRLPGRLNGVYGTPVRWLSGSRALLCQLVDPNRPRNPPAAAAPAPVIQESTGEKAPVRTFQDLLQTPHDEALFDHYATAQLAVVDASSGRSTPVGRPHIFTEAEASPDGRHLLVSRVARPYSYLVGVQSFPEVVEVWDRAGKVVHTIAQLPLAERVPIGGVLPGPRGVHWIPTEPGTLAWVEALDGGDPRNKVPHRDRLRTLAAPFAGEPKEWLRTEHRCTGLQWLETGRSALVTEFDRDRRWTRTHLAARQDGATRLVTDRSINDRYRDPGTPLTRVLPNGHPVVIEQDGRLFYTGEGSSPEGDRPFLDRLSLDTLKTERLFRSEPGTYETVVALLEQDGSRFITRRETEKEPPNYRLRGGAAPVPLTQFPDPTPQIRDIKKRLVTYRRADGVPLSFTLYLPPGYQEGQRLPTLVWAYPREFGDADTAGQVSGSAHRFTTMAGISHLFLVLQGYAVLDGATMPVVGSAEKANDTFIEQIVASGQAAIDQGVELGVVDRERVMVGGHSYGAFMTANLLAHSDLFRGGIARSGAYNRTLTPFGFQSERRTLWEAPEVYFKLSPFIHAHKINEPLLLIHGEADNNPGTFPVQTERLFHAIKGNGGIARYVSLPHESHGYTARESVEHTLYEMINWADRYLRQSPSTSARPR